MGRLSYTWGLMGASWGVLKQNKGLIALPLISGLCCLLVMVSFAIPIFLSGGAVLPNDQQTVAQQVLFYATLFLFYFVNYFIIVFFNSAVISCAILRMQGGNPTVSDGLRMAAARLPFIAGWAFLSATVGLILRIIEDKSEWVGRIVAGLLGMAWAIVSFLVVPVLIVEKKGPFEALKESTAMLKKTWGEQLVSNFGFGLIFLVLGIPGIVLIVVGGIFTASASAVLGGVLIALGIIYFIALGLVQSTLQTIFQAALYLYARSQEVPEGFDQQMLSGAIARK
ncbi:MAG: hypothetical protein GXP25_15305 [Planctomycetes bacterium]|nr:hypothetical protein [Planctomycetota bacterium]